MAEPGFLENCADRWYLFWNTSVRVRVWEAGGALHARALGYLGVTPPERLRRAVLERDPPGPGVVDFKYDLIEGWRIRGYGALDDPEFLQHLRNVVVNDL